jgi:hypothetical protein
LPATFVEDLQQAVTGFEQQIAGRNAGKVGAAVSQHAIGAALKKGLDTVLSLDALVRNVLGGDGNAMKEWKRARHVEFAGRTATAGPTSDEGTSVPASQEEHPIPSAAHQTSQPSTNQPPAVSTVEEPMVPGRAA